jgi:predicted nucleotidyltransferase
MDRDRIADSVSAAMGELKRALAETYGPRLEGAFLYGSHARGDFREGSDVDVLVALEGDVAPSREIDRLSTVVHEIGLRHDLLIAVYPVSASWLRERKSPLFENVRREGVPV